MTSLVLPTFNPGPGIDRIWYAVRDFLSTRKEPWEAIFVLDGCTDGSANRIDMLARATPPDVRMKVVSYASNRGKGYALRMGLLAATGIFRIFTDVDLAYSFDDIVQLAEVLWAGNHVAIANREHPGSTMTIPVQQLNYFFRRNCQSRVFRTIAKMLLPIRLTDTQAGLKGMSSQVAETLLPHIQCDGFGFDCEFLTACHRAGIKIEEIPVHVIYQDSASTTGFSASLKMIRDLWRIRKSWRKMTDQFVLADSLATPRPNRHAA